MVKVFTVNEQGKITFTKKELERVLNEAWQDGYNSNYTHSYWWNSPTVRTGNFSTVSTAISPSLENVPSEEVGVNVSSESVSIKYGV